MNNPLTTAELDEFIELEKRATPGPWEVGPDIPVAYNYAAFVHGHNQAKARVLQIQDAEFIVAARNISPRLVERVKELTFELGVARKEGEQWADSHDTRFKEVEELQAQVKADTELIAELLSRCSS